MVVSLILLARAARLSAEGLPTAKSISYRSANHGATDETEREVLVCPPRNRLAELSMSHPEATITQFCMGIQIKTRLPQAI
jgi:hypothetical protein